MYGNHPQGTYSKRDLVHASRASTGAWRSTAGRARPVKVTRTAPKPANLTARRNALYGF